jgi:hypothetical protein
MKKKIFNLQLHPLVEGILMFEHPHAGHVIKQLEILTAAAFSCLNQVCICTLHFLPSFLVFQSSCMWLYLQSYWQFHVITNDVLLVLAKVEERLKVTICIQVSD